MTGVHTLLARNLKKYRQILGLPQAMIIATYDLEWRLNSAGEVCALNGAGKCD